MIIISAGPDSGSGGKVKFRTIIPLAGFTDIQIAGPYTKWEHAHIFEEQGDKTLMLDSVVYRLPFSYLGRLVHDKIVKNQLRGHILLQGIEGKGLGRKRTNKGSIAGR